MDNTINVSAAKDKKTELRLRLIDERNSMTPAEVSAKSGVISQKLMSQIDWFKVKSIHIYQPMPGWNEVDTDWLIKELGRRWEHLRIDSPSFKKNQLLPAKQYDLIIVPTLGFNSNNYRIGMGGGWYDRFLAGQKKAIKIGLCFHDGFIRSQLPHEEHDIKLDWIITEV